MRPAARLSAAIEVLDRYLAGTPVEKALTNWARGARYAGSGDRAAIRDIVFDCLRRRASYAAQAGAETGRGLVAAHCVAAEGVTAAVTLFDGSPHAPAALSSDERARLSAAPDLSKAAAYDLPDWLVARFEHSFGPRAAEVAEILKSRAPVFLRVDLSRTGRAEAITALGEDDIGTRAHEAIGTALCVTRNPRRVAGCRLYREGLIELQDASSQAACADLPTAKRMLDFCAGGGGKVLAYGARVGAELFAHDAHAQRMKDLPDRAKRARRKITRLDLAACEKVAPFDLVLTDVPCSGSGTWRRAPEGKWLLTPDGLDALRRTQAEIMDQAAGLLEPEGILAYMTCSVLTEENEDQLEGFLSRNPGFEIVHQRRFEPGPDGDGFFAAHLTRRGPRP